MYKENDAQLRAKRIFLVIDRHHNTIHRDYNRYRRRERGDLVVAKPRSIKYAYTQINASEKKKKKANGQQEWARKNSGNKDNGLNKEFSRSD